MKELKVDPTRETLNHTGYYVRALGTAGYTTADIVTLDKASLLEWLQADPSRPEAVVLALLGHYP